MRYFVAATIALVASDAAFGHGLNVEARHRGGKLVVIVQFDDGTPVKDGIVKLPVDQRVQTDDKGIATLEIPGVGKHVLSVDAGDGHVVTMDITVPPMPWTEDQLFSPSQRPFVPSRLMAIIIGLFVIVLVMFIAMKSMSRRQPS